MKLDIDDLKRIEKEVEKQEILFWKRVLGLKEEEDELYEVLYEDHEAGWYK